MQVQFALFVMIVLFLSLSLLFLSLRACLLIILAVFVVVITIKKFKPFIYHQNVVDYKKNSSQSSFLSCCFACSSFIHTSFVVFISDAALIIIFIEDICCFREEYFFFLFRLSGFDASCYIFCCFSFTFDLLKADRSPVIFIMMVIQACG